MSKNQSDSKKQQKPATSVDQLKKKRHPANLTDNSRVIHAEEPNSHDG